MINAPDAATKADFFPRGGSNRAKSRLGVTHSAEPERGLFVGAVAYQMVFLIVGLLGVIFSARFFLKGAIAASIRFGIPEFLVGSLIVAVGTSAPEFAINIAASLQQAGDVIASNIIGSNIVNIGLGIGFAGLLVRYTASPPAYLSAAFVGLAGAVALLLLTVLSGEGESARYSRFAALIFVLGFAGFAYWSIWHLNVEEEEDELPGKNISRAAMLALLVLGALGMSFFADMTVSNAVDLATQLGIPSVVIGATIVAAGGSLPEVFACIEAARLKRPNIVVGNIVGSQVFNIFGILGISGLVATFEYDRVVANDLIFLIAMTVIWIISFRWLPLRQRVAPIFLAIYALYALYLICLALCG